MKFENNIDFAKHLDSKDDLKDFRDKFYFPLMNGKPAIYLTGNSLGLQPKTTQDYVLNELEDWANFGVEGHFHARKPWMPYHENFTDQLANLVGALAHEVVAMNQLTVNLHLLMVSFYQPTATKYKIICEAKAFPSDQYAIESQVKFHGFNAEDAIVEIAPRDGEHCLRTEDILTTIDEHKNSAALIILGGVNYYTGQVLDMETIAVAAKNAGITIGYDLAHAAGNVNLELHNWGVDFACWCSYKYLNSGPGGVSGVYIHERHAKNTELSRFAGWWGYEKETRFEMRKGFQPMATAEGWQISNAPVLSMAAHKAALDIFSEAGKEKIYTKGKLLSDYLMYLIDEINAEVANPFIEMITPRNDKGCQVSLLIHKDGKKIFEALKKHGVIADWREPNVIRVAPVALYNSFEDVYQFGAIIRSFIQE